MKTFLFSVSGAMVLLVAPVFAQQPKPKSNKEIEGLQKVQAAAQAQN